MDFSLRGKKLAVEERQCDDWVEEYMRYVEHTEPPLSYHKWTAIGSISAALQRRVYLSWGMETVYPNLYIVLVGPPAQTRKSTALRIGEDLVKQINIPMIGQDNSPEAIIQEIKKSANNFSEGDGGGVIMQSAMCCFASELSVFLGQQNVAFQAYLTDWWDSPDEWKRTTKHQGTDDISGMCFTLVGAMAPDWIPHIFTPASIGGGFSSRIIFVPETRKYQTIVNPNKCPSQKERRSILINDLTRISRMVGPFHLSPKAETFYEKWYTADEAQLQDGHYAVPDRTFHSYCGRRSVILRKTSMCIAASRSSDMVVQEEDISDALDMILDTERRLPGTFSAVGRSAQANSMSIVMKILAVRKTMKRSEILAEYYQDMSATEFDEVEKNLEAMQYIKVTRIPASGDSEYMWLI